MRSAGTASSCGEAPPCSSPAAMADTVATKLRRHETAGEYTDPDYPAHLHINVAPAARGTGAAEALVHRFLDHAGTAGAPGCYLQSASSPASVSPPSAPPPTSPACGTRAAASISKRWCNPCDLGVRRCHMSKPRSSTRTEWVRAPTAR